MQVLGFSSALSFRGTHLAFARYASLNRKLSEILPLYQDRPAPREAWICRVAGVPDQRKK